MVWAPVFQKLATYLEDEFCSLGFSLLVWSALSSCRSGCRSRAWCAHMGLSFLFMAMAMTMVHVNFLLTYSQTQEQQWLCSGHRTGLALQGTESQDCPGTRVGVFTSQGPWGFPSCCQSHRTG